MFAAGVVVGFDLGEDFGAGVVGVDEGAALEHLGFEGAHEGFGPGVVIGVGLCGHALPEVVGGQQLAEDSAAILAATVAMEDGVIGFAEGAGAGGWLEGVADEAGFEVVRGGPADDAPGAEVDDNGQIELTGGGGKIGDVARPDLVGLGWEGLVEQQVGRGEIGAAIVLAGHAHRVAAFFGEAGFVDVEERHGALEQVGGLPRHVIHHRQSLPW